MPIIFYTTKVASPPCRAVDMIIKIIKLDVEYRNIDLFAGEYMESWYLKINPAHQVPALDDNGFILTDSHAIIGYLLTVYAPKEILEEYYPTDPKQRALIDSRWHYENGMLFARLKAIFLLVLKGRTHVSLEATKFVIESLDIMEKFWNNNEWLAGDKLTVADISTVTTIDLVPVLVPLKHYKNISAWAEKARKTIPFYKEIAVEDIENFRALLKNTIDYDAEERWDQIHNGVKE